MSETKRKNFTGKFKVKVALEVIRGINSANEIVQEFGVHPTQVGVNLKGYAKMSELLMRLTKYFVFYNTERPHQTLGYDAPDEVYRTAIGSGARIVDKYSEKKIAPRNGNKKEAKTRVAPFRRM